jgi:hypothetical protein
MGKWKRGQKREEQYLVTEGHLLRLMTSVPNRMAMIKYHGGHLWEVATFMPW